MLLSPVQNPPFVSGVAREGGFHVPATGSTRPARIGHSQALQNSSASADMFRASSSAAISNLSLPVDKCRTLGTWQESSSSVPGTHSQLQRRGLPLNLLHRTRSREDRILVLPDLVSGSDSDVRCSCTSSLHQGVHSLTAVKAEEAPSQAQKERAPREGSGAKSNASKGPKGPPRIVLVNTMTGAKEELVPKQEGKLGMYVCGVTVYDYSHIGHARVYVSFDALYR